MGGDKEKKYWFYIESYIHISVKKDRVLFYNPYTGKMLEYANNPEIMGLVRRLMRPGNLQAVLLMESELKRPSIGEFIEAVREYFIGDMIHVSHSRGKPVNMPPILKIQEDVGLLKKDPLRTLGEGILEYLTDIWIYINNRCSLECRVCPDAFRQFPFCTAVKGVNRELDIALVQNFLKDVQHIDHLNIHILGGDITAYPQLDRLLQTLEVHSLKHFYIHYMNAAENTDWLRRITAHGGELKIPATFPLETGKMEKLLETIAEAGIRFTLIFAIRSVEEFDMADELSGKLQPGTVEFHPCYDGSNLDFFKENLFVRKEDIQEERPTLKEIYARSVVNPINFGNLTVRPDGRFFANVNEVSLGRLGIDSLYDILLKEMEHGNSWRKVRRHILPCKRCTFELLCPPISNYNRVIGQYDLCHLKNRKNRDIE
jgi:pseudo-rSAM protein